MLLERHKPAGQIVTLTIGPPTPTDIDMAARFLAGQKQRNPGGLPDLVEVLALPGSALLGTNPLIGAHLDMEMDEGGEVII